MLLASRAAARALAPAPVAVLAVGEGTAEEARRRGFTDVRAAGGTAETLAALASRVLDPARGPLLLAVGRGYSLELARDLRARGFRVIRRLAYAAAPATALPEAARAVLAAGRVAAILFHSPRSARCAMTLIRDAGLAEHATRAEALAISQRVAQAAMAAAAPFAWRAMRVAAHPDQESLLALLGPAPAGAPPAGDQ